MLWLCMPPAPTDRASQPERATPPPFALQVSVSQRNGKPRSVKCFCPVLTACVFRRQEAVRIQDARQNGPSESKPPPKEVDRGNVMHMMFKNGSKQVSTARPGVDYTDDETRFCGPRFLQREHGRGAVLSIDKKRFDRNYISRYRCTLLDKRGCTLLVLGGRPRRNCGPFRV